MSLYLIEQPEADADLAFTNIFDAVKYAVANDEPVIVQVIGKTEQPLYVNSLNDLDLLD